MEELGLPVQDAKVITEDREVAGFFEATLEHYDDAKVAANWVMRDVLQLIAEAEEGFESLKLTPEHFAELLELVDAGKLTAGSARKVITEMAESGARAEPLMHEHGLEAVSDTGELEVIAQEIIDANADQVAQFRGGEQKVFNFFVGQMMKKTRGKADPGAVREILTRLLAG